MDYKELTLKEARENLRRYVSEQSEVMSQSGLKNDQEKPRVDLLDPEFLEEVGAVMAYGAKKYAAHNWRSGIALSRLLGGILRHTFALLRGEDLDPETGCSHAAHATCGLMFFYWTLKYKKEFDDRFKY